MPNLNPFPQERGWHFRWNAGPWLRPVLYPWRWFSDNPWFGANADNLWFVFRVSSIKSYPFLSYVGKKRRFYVGWKCYGLDHPEYNSWLPSQHGPAELVNGDHASFAVVLSSTLRKNP